MILAGCWIIICECCLHQDDLIGVPGGHGVIDGCTTTTRLRVLRNHVLDRLYAWTVYGQANTIHKGVIKTIAPLSRLMQKVAPTILISVVENDHRLRPGSPRLVGHT